MRFPIVFALVLLPVQLATDAYLFSIAWRRCRRPGPARFQLWSSAFFLVYIVVFMCMPKRGDSEGALLAAMWMLFIYLSIYAGKAVFAVTDLIASAPLLWGGRRVRAVTAAGAVLGAGLSAAMWWGALCNRFDLRVNELTIEVEGLPESFDGYRVVQISDLHVGTLGSDTAYVASVVERVNALDPDMVVFTGDLVNRKASELRPFVGVLRGLRARDGVYSILGNHDYGDYCDWPSATAKEQNMEWLMDMQIEMGWELLTNSSAVVYGDTPGDSIVVIGVENIGDPPFPTYGDLELAYPTPADSAVKILLTHNPVHWTRDIAPRDTMNIALTLSGHTHAMQMAAGGVSPAALRYETWGGLYESPDGRRPLYVNIGAGTVGIPMRLGANPEISLFELRIKN